MPASDFIGLYSAMMRDERQRFNEQQKISAFTGWQFLNHIGSMLGSTKMPSFIEYSDTLNLLNEEEKEYLGIYKQLQKLQNKQAAAQNLAAAANIIELDKRRK